MLILDTFNIYRSNGICLRFKSTRKYIIKCHRSKEELSKKRPK